MNQLTVQTSTHDYSIYIGQAIRHNITAYLPKKYTSILIVTDASVAELYLQDVKDALVGERVFEEVIPSGEASKSIEQYYHLQTIALQNNLDRNSLIIALGGGVVGDLAGFVAATFMRGIDYIQMPTTILSHDSSVGGKVAINHELGKNMIGNFYPPRAVVYDVDTVQTLPQHEVRSGYAEIIKEAYIANESLVQQLLNIKITEVSKEQLSEHLYKGIQIKADIVEQDEKESHVRKFLNFGHTLAHAIEAELSYEGGITHGEAVAIGMLFALRVSEDYYKIDLNSEAYVQWLILNDYPRTLFNLSIEQMIYRMKLDKKVTNQQIQMVLLNGFANPQVVQFEDEQIKQYLTMFKKELNEA